MDIRVIRDILTDESTTGQLFINDEFWCFTLEDKTRDAKKYGKTCIPLGRYQVDMVYWDEKKGYYPHLMKVPGYTGILIHKGNTKEDTLGCILVAMNRGKDRISNCAPAFTPLRKQIREAVDAGEEVWVEVTQDVDAVDERTSTT